MTMPHDESRFFRQEAETGPRDSFGEESNAFECGTTTCQAHACFVLADKYDRQRSVTTGPSFIRNVSKTEYCANNPNILYEITETLTRGLLSRGGVFKPKFRRKSQMSRLLLFLCVLSCLFVCEARKSGKGGPPRLLAEAKTKITAIEGQTLSLPCLVVADPFPLTSWKVNGELIPVSRPRFKEHGFSLRIRDVRLSDEGTYRCIATNGFGSAEVEVKLIVQAHTEERSTPKKPRFLLPAKMRRRTLNKPIGSFLKLRCKSSGFPTPNIEWFKDGNRTVPADYNPGKQRPNWVYTIRNLQLNDSGQYKCRVWNKVGEISYVYKVRVADRLRDSPVLLEPHPMNTTVRVGGMTTIQCRVDSVVKPTIKWIKRLDKSAIASYGKDLPDNIITIEGKHYLILPTQEMLSLPDGSYLNKLVIRGATEQHAGMYICLGANTRGYNYKYAYLKVVADPIMSSLQGTEPTRSINYPRARPPQNKQGSLSLPGIIGVPAGIGVLAVITIAWYCQRRKYRKLNTDAANVAISGSDRLSAVGSVDTKSSARSSPIPHDSENPADTPTDTNNKLQHTGNDHRQRPEKIHEGVYTHRHTSPPTVGTPLLTVTEPDDAYFQVNPETDDDEFVTPTAPPPSVMATSQAPSYYSSSDMKSDYRAVPPPPPPPSQYSASSISSYPDTMPQYPPHYHYMHTPHSSNSRRHHHHHHYPSHHHSRGHPHHGH